MRDAGSHPPNFSCPLRACRERHRRRAAAQQRDEIVSHQLIELHLVPFKSGVGLQDIELATNSQ